MAPRNQLRKIYGILLENVKYAMRKWEIYHTSQSFDNAGVMPFLKHAEEYIMGERTIPVCKTSSTLSEFLLFTYVNDLLRICQKNPGKLIKPHECALKFGFRGYSAGGKNGIFYIRSQDSKLSKIVAGLIPKYENEIREDLDIWDGDIYQLKKIKVVYHSKIGERLVGVLNEQESRAIMLGFAHY